MTTYTHPVRIDTRLLLQIYTGIAMATGVTLVLFGPWLVGPDPAGVLWVRASAIRQIGALMIVAGCFSLPLARVDDPEGRRRGLLWFAIAHAILTVLVWAQYPPYRDGRWVSVDGSILAAVALLMFYLWQFGKGDDGRFGAMVSLFGDSDASATRRLRSEYEHRIQMAASQEERHRLARDLHDSIKQQLFAIHTAAATAQARFDGDTGGARVAVEQIRASAREAMAEMDAMLHGLRAAPLENTGMVEALKQACEALAFRTGASVEFLPGDLPPSASLPPGVTDAIFRVAQEALSNVARHARASHVRVTLERTGRQLQLVVKDDGSGFDQARAAHGSGLANMRARAAEYEGRLEVVSTPGAGTRLSLAIPVVADPDDAKYYLRRAIGFCAVGLLNVVVPILGEGHLWVTSVPLLLVMLLAGGLDLVAYSRTRRPPEVRR